MHNEWFANCTIFNQAFGFTHLGVEAMGETDHEMNTCLPTSS
ncbi:MAG: hypothetical protein ACWGN1_02950 [Desulfobulbales bacterium]